MNVTEQAKRLEARRRELPGRLVTIEQDLDAPMPADWDEQAIEREGEEVMEHLGAQGIAEVRAIDAALGRVRDGTYGICVNCGEPIGEARLQAVPHAARCRTCAR